MPRRRVVGLWFNNDLERWLILDGFIEGRGGTEALAEWEDSEGGGGGGIGSDGREKERIGAMGR